MHIRFIVQAGLLHGVILLGVGLGVRPFLATERPRVELTMQLETPAPEILEDPEIEELVLDEFLPELEFEEIEIAEAPLDELQPSEAVEDAPPEREVEPHFAVPPRLKPGPDLLLRMKRTEPQNRATPQPPEVQVAELTPVPADTPAEVLDGFNKKPLYPDSAHPRRLNADVVLLLTVSVRGEVSNLEILESAGLTRAHKDMNASAIAAVCQWRYRPAIRGGVPVEVRIRVPVQFRYRR